MTKTDGGHIFTRPEDQDQAVEHSRIECVLKGAQEALKYLSSNATDLLLSDTCPLTWDGILCWPTTAAGVLQSQPCPAYIAGFDSQAEATRLCTGAGQWFVHQQLNTTWSNYSMCYKESVGTVVYPLADLTNVSHTTHWIPVVKRMSQVGYSFSLLSLLVAFCILATTKKLRCPRNTLHMHLFVSFILRAFMALLKDSLFVQGVGLSSDVVVKDEGSYFSQQEHNWACKCVTSLWQFCIMANYSWILMEGLYLHNLIFLALFSDSSAITLYVLLGWGLPVLVVAPWVALRATFEDDYCWTTNSKTSLFLVISLPTAISIVINFVLFLNIVRVLFLKLRSSISEETRRYRKWARSTLVLVPLFGVHYSLFYAMKCSIGGSQTLEILWLFGDQLFASFQGFCVAVLYCFLNGEVRTEMSKKWRHRRWPWRWKAHDVLAAGRRVSTTGSGAGSRAGGGGGGFLARRLHWNKSSCVASNCTSVETAGGRRTTEPTTCPQHELFVATRRDTDHVCNNVTTPGGCCGTNGAPCERLLPPITREALLEMQAMSP